MMLNNTILKPLICTDAKNQLKNERNSKQLENDKLKKSTLQAVKDKFSMLANFTLILRYIWFQVDDSSQNTILFMKKDDVIGGSNLTHWLTF